MGEDVRELGSAKFSPKEENWKPKMGKEERKEF